MSGGHRTRSPRVERERRWLRALFGSAIVAVTAPAALIQGCGNAAAPAPGSGGSSSSTGGHPDAAEPDRTAHGGSGGGGGGGAGGFFDAGGDACPIPVTITQLDATVPDSGPDADFYCRIDLPCGVADTLGFVGCDLVFEGPDGSSIGSAYGCTLITDAGCPDDASIRSSDLSLLCGCDALNGGGRRPFGGRTVRRVRARDAITAYLARMAHAEAASVVAFDELAASLERLGAPRDLVVASRRSAVDEIRHAATMTRLARRRGVEPPPVRRRSPRPRAIESIARENAVEGCVRETFGALVATWQAQHAEDPALRRAFTSIAVDETRHAALSWAIAAWIEAQLDPGARARVASAGRAALRSLARELASEPDPTVVEACGLPRGAAARSLLRSLEAGLAKSGRRQGASVAELARSSAAAKTRKRSVSATGLLR
jgi:hypothetical protein